MHHRNSISISLAVASAFTVLILVTVNLAATADARNQPDHAASLQAILDSDRRAHLEGNASLIAANLADQVVEVSAGESHTRSREEIQEFFDTRFETVSYLVWRDGEEPIIHLSADMQMAWVVRSIEAEIESVDEKRESGQNLLFTSVYTATYELFDRGWKMTSVTSTFAPASDGG